MSSPPLPRPYQIAGADFLAARDTALLGDDPGLGKTRQAIMAMEQVQAERTLIICPAIARLVWPAEIARWAVNPAKVWVLDPKALKKPPAADLLLRELFAPVAGIIAVVAFDTISADRHWALVQMLCHADWDLVIIDEGHRLAHAGSKRTQSIYGERLDGQDGIIERAERVWVLTGTPTPNHAGELYTHARALFPDEILIGERPMEEHEFIERYCRYRDTVHGRQITGSQNLPELRARMKNRVLRRRKTDVLKELPPMDFVVVPVPGTELRAVPGADEAVPSELEGDELLAYLASHAVHLATLRRLLGEAKLQACVDWLIDLLESGTQKVVVFAHHVGILNKAAGLLAEYNPVLVNGQTTDPQRQTAIERFQAEPETRVFLGQIDACGTAITLTAAHDVVMFECSWVPGANYQAASRCHRLGQRDGVLVRMLCVPDSLDERIVATFQRKANEIAQLWD